MAVSKRTRFEVLRRDGFRCTYCGLPASETGEGLTVDHVIPVALGGSDALTNLTTACKDCNAGKSSASLDASPIPDAVAADVQLLAAAQRSASIRADLHAFDDTLSRFDDAWNMWHRGSNEDHKIPRPFDWKTSVSNLARQGAPFDLFDYAIPIAMSRADRKFGEHAEFVYMLGIVRNKLEDYPLDYRVTASTAKTYTYDDLLDARRSSFQAGKDEGYDSGFNDGEIFHEAFVQAPDLLAMHVDGRTDNSTWERWNGA